MLKNKHTEGNKFVSFKSISFHFNQTFEPKSYLLPYFACTFLSISDLDIKFFLFPLFFFLHLLTAFLITRVRVTLTDKRRVLLSQSDVIKSQKQKQFDSVTLRPWVGVVVLLCWLSWSVTSGLCNFRNDDVHRYISCLFWYKSGINRFI